MFWYRYVERVRAVSGNLGYPWNILARCNVPPGYRMHRVALVYPAHHLVPLIPFLSRSPKVFTRALNLAARSGILEIRLTCKKTVDSS